MPFATPVVPMPRWSTPVGCTKLFLTIVVLAFVIACAIIWGFYPAFSISIFTASFSLVTFGYYMIALCFKPALYNKLLVLFLETTLTLFWFVSLVLLAGWTGANSGIPQTYYDLRPYPTPYGTAIEFTGKSHYRRDTMFTSWQPSGLCKRRELDNPKTMIRHHGANAHYAAQLLAGIAAGLAGIIFILYGTTTAVFAMNYHKSSSQQPESTQSTTSARTPNDEESQTHTISQPQTRPEVRSHEFPILASIHPSPHRSKSIHAANTTQVPLHPMTQEPPLPSPLKVTAHSETTDEANDGASDSPTPLLSETGIIANADAEKQQSHSNEEMSGGISKLGGKMGQKESWKRTSTIVKEDGRVEREI